MRSTINTKIYVSLIKKLKYAIRNNYKAFTYIELLLALTITIIILTILPLIINSTKFFDYHLSTNSDIELELFARDLIADFSTSPSLDIENHSTLRITRHPHQYPIAKVYANIVIRMVRSSRQ